MFKVYLVYIHIFFLCVLNQLVAMNIPTAHLNKDELIFELSSFGIFSDPNATRGALRQQLRQALRLQRRGSLKLDAGEVVDDVATITTKVIELETLLAAEVPSTQRNTRMKARSTYLLYRIERMKDVSGACMKLKSRLVRLLAALSDDESGGTDSESELQSCASSTKPHTSGCPHDVDGTSHPIQFNERLTNLNSFNIKYDGTTCIRAFLERVKELQLSRNVSEKQLLNGFPDLLVKAPLFWFRANRSNFKSLNDLFSELINDFDTPDYDYKLMNEIRNRSQFKNESIVAYLSVMQQMFSRLNRDLSEEQKLEILLHNIRPEYIKDLAMIDITTISQLKSLLMRLEFAKDTADNFIEPNNINFSLTSDMNTSLPRGKHKIENLKPQPSQPDPSTKNSKCLKCGLYTHTTNKCSDKTLVCYKCGKKGCKVSNCPNYRPKNL